MVTFVDAAATVIRIPPALGLAQVHLEEALGQAEEVDSEILPQNTPSDGSKPLQRSPNSGPTVRQDSDLEADHTGLGAHFGDHPLALVDPDVPSEVCEELVELRDGEDPVVARVVLGPHCTQTLSVLPTAKHARVTSPASQGKEGEAARRRQ